MKQNIIMKTKTSFCLLCVLFLTSFFACVFPYPFFSNSVLVGNKIQTQINDFFESEKQIKNNGKVEVMNLDWFDAMNQIFVKYTPVRVIDVETKKSYVVQRGGGYNHADVEPVDAENTAIFKSLYGEWSWTRRAVWVQIGSNFYAASINGMPHGFDLISQNNMDGHSCIHFLNSKTHGSKKVDPAHQECVKKAAQTPLPQSVIDYASK